MAPPAPITRRDFLNGSLLALASPLAAAGGEFQGQTLELAAAAHRLRDEPGAWQGAAAEVDAEVEDLVVVGGGISGLAGAHLYAQHAGRPVRILVLDALDEIGGHARRNEFVTRSGRVLVGYGGSQSLDSPSLFSPAVQSLLKGLGLDLSRFEREFYDAGWAARHGLEREGIYFDPAVWGAQQLVLREKDEAAPAWLARTPLPPRAQADLARLMAPSGGNPLARWSRRQRREWLAKLSYRDFLHRHWHAHPAVATYLQSETSAYFGVGIDATSALDAWALGLPGFGALDLGESPDRLNSPSGRQLRASQDKYIYHFPDGNAGLVRALLRAMRPALVPGQGMETLSTARLDVAALDDPAAAIRFRQRATVVGLRHLGEPSRAELVELRYVDARGRLRLVRARQVLLACWHQVIARITDEMPEPQRQALRDQVKVPLIYANVLLPNWHAFARAGLRSFSVPGGFWNEAALDFPVSMGDIRFAESPADPILLHLSKVVVPGDGADPRTQARAGRAQLLGWSFEFLESSIRELLQGAMGAYGFNAQQDIEAITLNRWSHGYSYEYMRPWDRYWPGGPLPAERARRGWGRVAIANSDAGAYAYAHSAIDQATRAVQELLPAARLPAWSRTPGPDPRRIGL